MKNKRSIYDTSKDVDFLNSPLGEDVQVFFDPSLLGDVSIDGFDSNAAKKKVSSFFSKVVHLYSTGKKDEAAALFTHFDENNSFGLGYSKSSRKGRGLSTAMVIELFDRLFKITELQGTTLNNPALYQMFIQNFGPDRFTDLLLTLIAEELTNFTNFENKKFNIGCIKLSNTSNHQTYWTGSVVSNLKTIYVVNDVPVTLIPYKILTKKYAFSIIKFLSDIVFPIVQEEYSKKNNGDTISKREIFKEKTREYHHLKNFGMAVIEEKPHLLVQYLDTLRREGSNTHSVPLKSEYDFICHT